MSKPNFNCDIYCLPFYSGEDGLGINPTDKELEEVVLKYHNHLYNSTMKNQIKLRKQFELAV